MHEMAGQWFVVEKAMDFMGVNQVLEFQRHGDHRKFGEIALSRHLINGRELKYYVNSLKA